MKDFLEIYAGVKRQQVRADHDWYSVKASDDGASATISIYDEISFWGVSAQDFAAELDALPTSVKTIELRLNSPGGSVFDGLTIANRLREHSAAVNVVVDGVAASIASVIAMAGDTVTMGRGATMMIHNPSGLVLGGAADMREMADLLDKLAKDSIASAYVAKAGGAEADWLAAMAAETWYSPSEAVTAGLADATTDDPPAPGNRGRTHDLTAYAFRYPGRDSAPDPAAQGRRIRSLAAVARVRSLREGGK